jgi:hypothetical protein
MGVSQSRIGCHTVGGAWGLALMTTGGEEGDEAKPSRAAVKRCDGEEERR